MVAIAAEEEAQQKQIKKQSEVEYLLYSSCKN